MKKENLLTAKVEEPNIRITRARVAAFHASGQMPTSKPPTLQVQKRALQANAKRATVDEKNSIGSDAACVQHKRRAVLKEVTNVLCENSYRNCINAVNIQSKNRKQSKRGQVKMSKVVPSVAIETPKLEVDTEIKMSPGIQKTGEIMCSKNKGKNIPLQSCTESTMRELVPSDCQHQKQNVGSCWLSQSPSKKVEKAGFFGKSITSSAPDVKDIDFDQGDPQMCSLYASEIYKNLRVAELIRRPCPNFMETIQRDITQSMRGILVDWLVEVSEEYRLASDTLFLTVYFIDWFLSQNYIERHRLQLLGITCMLIASKYEEACAPRVEHFCFITDNTYKKGEVLKMENQVLNHFGFQLFAPTTKTFLRRYLRAAQATYKCPCLELEYLANYLAELTLIDYSFLNFLPSLTAASAIFLARWTLDQSGHPWNSTLEHYTTYKAFDLKTSVFALQDLQSNTNGCLLNAVRSKYQQEKFKYVASLSPPRLLSTLFQI